MTNTAEQVPHHRAGSGGARLAILGLALLGTVVATAWWFLGFDFGARSPLRPRSVTTGQTGGASDTKENAFIGDRSCGECHPGEAAAHSRSGHSKSLVHVTDQASDQDWITSINGRTVVDPTHPAVSFSFHARDGKLEVERTENSSKEVLPVDYLFGSGHHGRTLMSLVADSGAPEGYFGIEHRLSYYAHLGTFQITTGQQDDATLSKGSSRLPMGRRMDAPSLRNCFACHATRLSASGDNHMVKDEIDANIRCERCHGPARNHVEAARALQAQGVYSSDVLKMPLGSSISNTFAELGLCGKCHRLSAQFASNMLVPENLGIVRLQPVGLVQSRCFRVSPDGLRCSTCHDPHARPSTDPTHYEAQCLSCHSGSGEPSNSASNPRKTTCPVSPRTGCLDCHMPKRKIPEGFVFTDHWIRRNRNLAELPGVVLPDHGKPKARDGVGGH